MTLILDDHDVRQLLSMRACVEAMELAFQDYAAGRGANFPRIRYAVPSPTPGATYGANVHIGAAPSCGVAAVRMGSFLRGDAAYRVEQHQQRNWGIVCLFSVETAELLAIVQEFELSGMRVGATTAIAVKHVTRPDLSTIGLFGSGKIARAHVEALALVRPQARVRVYSPTAAHREAFAAEMAEQLGLQIEPVSRPEDAVEGMDLVCCCTNAGYVDGRPVFPGSWLRPGQVVTTVQNTDVHAVKSEVDEETFVRADAIVINDRESVFANRQRELLDPIDKGLFGWEKVHELGAVVSGSDEVRSHPDNIVYVKNNTGMGIQMAAAGSVVYHEAVRKGRGHKVPTEWFGSSLTEWYERGYRPSP